MMAKNFKSYHANQGYLLIAAVILVVVVSFVALVIANISVTESQSTVNQLQTTKAFYIAQAGLQRGIYGLLSEGTGCAAITGDPSYTNVSFGGGTFTVTGTYYAPTSTSLSVDINDTTTTIPVVSLSGYAPFGRVYIGGEAIDYGGTSTSSASCGGLAPCLTNALRGAAGTTAVTHSAGDSLSQNQCHLESSGGIPNLTSPEAKRVVSQEVIISTGQGWIVGDNAAGNDVILNWLGTSWTRSGPHASVPDVDLNGVTFASKTDSSGYAWAVGDRQGGDATIIYWDGANWSRIIPSASVPNKNLNSVTCVDPNHCWAVGDSATFIQWNGTSWINNASVGVSKKNIYDVACVASNDCWAVGKKDGTALIMYWNGSIWSRYAAGTVASDDLYGVTCVDSNNCWVVGKKGTFGYWNGVSWSGITPGGALSNIDMQGVTCNAINDCWAVGDRQGGNATIARWNGATWFRITPAASVNNSDLYNVSCLDANTCWAVGQNKSIAFWNGSIWAGFSPDASVPNAHLRSVIFSEGIRPEAAFWKEKFD